jgi:hypothetical protein
VGQISNGTHQLLAYADDGNMTGGRTNAIKKYTEIMTLVKVKAEKPKYGRVLLFLG